MHHEASQPIFYRDIKSSNILLDHTFTPKVADFGISRLQPSNEMHLCTKSPSGTLGYEDPQFKASCQFTNKSDVYSFGVVLVELLTGKPAVMSPPELSRDGDMYFLYDHFLSAFNDNRLIQIVDPRVVSDRTLVQMKNMAQLAKACLEMEGMARPSMREVVGELAWIRGGTRQPGIYGDVTLLERRGTSS
ncbi:hypothetical protein SUGI_0464010 [Cryptomeria japonica]|nr:hypothetical protein SUGI_0464010 [Cryptomeria japonica]